MIPEGYNIDVRATSRHRSSILEHRIILQDLVYICVYIYRRIYFSSLFPECTVSHGRKTRLSFLRANFSIAKPALRFLSKTNESGRIARAIFTLEYRARNGTSFHDQKARVRRAREGSDFQSDTFRARLQTAFFFLSRRAAS